MIQGICNPIIFVDLAGSACLIIISVLCFREARRIVRKEPENFFYGYMYWLFIALFAFSLSRSLGHIVKHLLLGAGLVEYWTALSPVSGSINSALFLLIASITVFFQKMKRVMEQIEQDKLEIERISQELLRLNKETEMLVSERTRAELALRIAHHIRNPIMVIGGLARRLIKKGSLSEDDMKKLELILEQIERLDAMVKEFELSKKTKSKSFTKEDLNILVKEVVDAVQPEAQRLGIKIEVEFEKTPLYISMDPDLIKFSLGQCLGLLMRKLSASKSIFIHLKREKFGAMVTLLTHEAGVFGKSVHVGRLTEAKDRQRPPITDRRVELSTVKQILEDHGGELSVKDQGQYVEIRLYLPFGIGKGKTWA